MSEERKEQCETCWFWEDNDDGDGSGTCHRYPPSAYTNPPPCLPGEPVEIDAQPTTYGDDWCGEWKATRQTIPERIDIRPLSVRARRVLNEFFKPEIIGDFLTREQFGRLTVSELLETRNCGEITIREYQKLANQHGISIPEGSA